MGKGLGQDFIWLSLRPASLQESRQSRGAGNGAQDLACSLLLLSMLSGQLVGKGQGVILCSHIAGACGVCASNAGVFPVGRWGVSGWRAEELMPGCPRNRLCRHLYCCNLCVYLKLWVPRGRD